eukprot:160150_1
MTTAVIRSRYLGETCGSSSECADGCACPTGICKNDQTKKRCPANPLKRPQTAAQIEEMIRTENVSPLKRPQTAAQIEEMIRDSDRKFITAEAPKKATKITTKPRGGYHDRKCITAEAPTNRGTNCKKDSNRTFIDQAPYCERGGCYCR